MKVLIINSSPRRSGNISKMLESASATASDTGCEVSVLNLYDLDIRPCVACMACRKKLCCPTVKDDMPKIEQAIREADAIIFGAPCYWGNMPGVLKTMFDRLVYLFIEKRGRMPHGLLKGKKALVITTSTTPMPWARLLGQTSGTVKSIHKILKLGGIKVLPSIQVGDTMNRTAGEKELRSVARRVKRLIGQSL